MQKAKCPENCVMELRLPAVSFSSGKGLAILSQGFSFRRVGKRVMTADRHVKDLWTAA